MKRIVIITSLLLSLNGLGYAQYSKMELVMGFREHDFDLADGVVTEGKGKVKYHLIIDDGGKLEQLELIKNSFDDKVDSVCRKELESLEFVPPPSLSLNKGEKYQLVVEFKFKKRFKSFSLNQPKKYP